MEKSQRSNNNGGKKPELNRLIITKIGERLYEFPDVDVISIQAEFKDGSGIRFRKIREEEDD